MPKTEEKKPVLSEEDLAAMIAAEDEYLKIRQRQQGKPPTKDIFYAGFHFGVAHARRADVAQGTPAPSAVVVDDDDNSDIDDED